jgi:tRNA pseudouridine55 synthase
MVEGVFAIYKEEGMTSHDVVEAVRRVTGQKRVGHAGTLDPCAKGVLVVGVGRAATRQLRSIAGTEKEYITRVKLGWRSTTDDREGKKEQIFRPTEDSGQVPSEGQVRQALTHFQGVINQCPPVFSAIKVRGRAAYKLARKGRAIDLPPRKVEVKEIELLGYAWPYVDVRLVTGPGFYVRSFARDLGGRLGTGAYMEELERIRVGTYTKERAARLTDLAASLRDTADGPPTS